MILVKLKMIILPNALPAPKANSIDSSSLESSLMTKRASLTDSTSENFNDLIRYLLKLEEYLEGLFIYVKKQANCEIVDDTGEFMSTCILGEGIPWSNLVLENSDIKEVLKKRKPIQWSLAHEIEVILLVISLMYTKLGSELTNELIELQEADEGTDEKWKQVINYHKKAIASTMFGAKICSITNIESSVNERIFTFMDKISNISIQMSILAKSSWINRNSFNSTETFETNSNGTLSRVSIYVLNELNDCMNLLIDLNGSLTTRINLNYKDWKDYLSIIQKYTTAYAGLFLSIEYYQKDKLGDALGLINFSLVSLQSKKLSELKPKQGKILSKFKSKLTLHKNDQYISNIHSVTTLNVNKSAFQESSGVILKDLSFLFDLLIQLHLKFSKENDNLKFDTVTDWQDISKDTKWPLGCKIPVSDIKMYEPISFRQSTGLLKENYTGRGSYY